MHFTKSFERILIYRKKDKDGQILRSLRFVALNKKVLHIADALCIVNQGVFFVRLMLNIDVQMLITF